MPRFKIIGELIGRKAIKAENGDTIIETNKSAIANELNTSKFYKNLEYSVSRASEVENVVHSVS